MVDPLLELNFCLLEILVRSRDPGRGVQDLFYFAAQAFCNRRRAIRNNHIERFAHNTRVLHELADVFDILRHLNSQKFVRLPGSERSKFFQIAVDIQYARVNQNLHREIKRV